MAKCWMSILVALFAAVAASSVAAESQKGKKKGAGAMLLEKMRNFVQTKGQIGLNPYEKADVAEIRQILMMDIMPSLFDNAEDAQNRINELYDKVVDCQVEVATGLEVTRQKWDDTITKKQKTYECFYKDKLIIDEETEVCTKFEKIKKILKPPVLPPPDRFDNSETYKYLMSLSEYFCEVPHEYKHTWEECTTLQKNHTERFHWCEDSETEYEEAICGYDATVVETCTAYFGCWNSSVADYHDHVATLTGLQEDWEAEMDAVSKLDCLWQTWNLSSDPCVVNMTMVYECEEKPINYSNVTLVIYKLPEPKTCGNGGAFDETMIKNRKSISTRTIHEGLPLPCENEFFDEGLGYLGLPRSEVYQVQQDCRPCMHTRPPTTEDPCAMPTVYEDNTKCAQDKFRLFREVDMDFESCYQKCKDTVGCEHFSVDATASSSHPGVCMGCIKPPAAPTEVEVTDKNPLGLQGPGFHYGFRFYDMPCPLRYSCGDCSAHEGEDATGGWDGNLDDDEKHLPLLFCNDGSRFLKCDKAP